MSKMSKKSSKSSANEAHAARADEALLEKLKPIEVRTLGGDVVAILGYTETSSGEFRAFRLFRPVEVAALADCGASSFRRRDGSTIALPSVVIFLRSGTELRAVGTLEQWERRILPANQEAFDRDKESASDG